MEKRDVPKLNTDGQVWVSIVRGEGIIQERGASYVWISASFLTEH